MFCERHQGEFEGDGGSSRESCPMVIVDSNNDKFIFNQREPAYEISQIAPLFARQVEIARK